MRIVYMGTPQFAAQVLENIVKFEHAEIVALYAQPDRQAGRGKKLHEPETKILATSLGIPVFQPQSFKNNPEALAQLKELNPDVLVVAAYGMLLPQEVLDIPKYGAYNVHASLLPQYRGAAPVQRALIAGDRLTGVTIMRMEKGLDTGPILLQQVVDIKDSESLSDNCYTLLEALADRGGKLMNMALNMIRDNRADVVMQNHEKATHAPKLTKQEALIDWAKSAEEIHNHVRGFSPNPGATAKLQINDKEPIQVRIEKGFVLERLGFDVVEWNTQNTQSPCSESHVGKIMGIYNDYILVKTGKGYYGISQIRLAGKDPMNAKAFNNGYFKNNESLQFLPKEAEIVAE